MFKSFLNTALRNMLRHKGFTLINMSGLTIGLTVCLLIALFIRDEKEFDRFIPQGDRVYRVYDERTLPDAKDVTPRTPPMFATALQQFPEVENTARILLIQEKILFEAGDKKTYEEKGIETETSFFKIFPLSFKYGSSSHALDDPSSLVISDQLAARYFGGADPTGKEILVNKEPRIIKGVFKSNPKFHLPAEYIATIASEKIPPERMQAWQWQQFFTYIKLKEGANAQAAEVKFRELIRSKVTPLLKESGMTYVPSFQPLKDIHLYSAGFKLDMAVRGDITYVKALTIIAVFILLIACFNFINLATAQSLRRAKEVGVRKSIGASRRQLMIQYILESVVFAFFSLVLSTALTYLFLPVLNRFTEKEIAFDLFNNPAVMGLLVLLSLVVGLIAGFYPAIVLSRFQPVKVLKGLVVSDQSPGKVQWFRQGLVVVQFSLSVLLIISSIVVIRQVNYLHHKDLGFNKEEIMFFPMRGDNMFRNYGSFKNELLKSPGISSVSIGYGFPGDLFAGDDIIVPRDGQMISQPVTQLMVDFDYIKTLGLQVVAGRDFSREMQTDQDHAFLLNETAVRQLGFGTPEKALGKTLYWKVWDSRTPDSLKKGEVIGVVRDFHYKSLHDKMEPTILQIYPPAYWKVAVKMKTAAIGAAMQHVKDSWSRFSPDYPIEYKFLDENFEQMYQAEDKLKSLLWLFTVIAIFVGCLGLFGLAAYTSERRKKEIGIRKVLGASVRGIALLLSGDFVKLVCIALLVATPIAWYFLNRWLEDFAYRIRISWWIFALAGLLAIVIALATVGFQAVKAAMVSPVRNLKNE